MVQNREQNQEDLEQGENFNYSITCWVSTSRYWRLFIIPTNFRLWKVFYLDFTPDGKELYQLLTRTELSHLERTWKASKSIRFCKLMLCISLSGKRSGHFLWYSEVKLQFSYFWLISQKMFNTEFIAQNLSEPTNLALL